jgi:hypothetical protein
VSASALLDGLQGVRPTGPGRWVARCPAHEDRSPSLSVRELPDGRVLLHCFAGCATADVLDSIGLTLAALFPEPLPGSGPAGGYPPSHTRIPARDLLDVISAEVTIVALLAADFLTRRSITEPDWKRLATAAARIGAARDHTHG